MASMRKLLLCLFVFAAMASAQAPSTVIHVVNVKWKVDATPEQIKAAVDAVHQLPSKYPGIKRVWTKNPSNKGKKASKQAMVMESGSRNGQKKTTKTPDKRGGNKLYLP